ncbi:hypothetical protein KY330_04750, partial [Candidatus Woesearchaeota archaeon]|nr:hypothetical protein [Candidatus Woesearchaeota archaeon]
MKKKIPVEHLFSRETLEELLKEARNPDSSYEPPEEFRGYYEKCVEYNKAIQRVWPVAQERFNYPMLSNPPYLQPYGVPTACFNFVDNHIMIRPSFLGEIVDLGVGVDDAVMGILLHEVAHYTDNPRERYKMILQQETVDRFFKQEPRSIQAALLNFFQDTYVNLNNMKKEESGKELRVVYQELAKKDDCSIVFKLLDAFYGDRIECYKASFKPDEKLQKKVEELRKVDYFNEEMESVYIKYFGEIILELLKEEYEQAKKYAKSCKSSKGDGSDKDLEERCGAGSATIEEVIIGKLHPMSDADGDPINKMSDKEIEDALNEIAKRKGLKEYQRIKDFVNRVTGKSHDKITRNKSDFDKPIAGLESAEITWHNEYIDFYRRKAAGKIYIQRKPMIVNASNSYPNGLTKYKVEDPFPLINLWSSPWILPGITQRNVLEPGVISDKKFEFPHLWLSIDSSGSMPHPSSMSNAILAGFILAINYHRNKRMIGVHNFSCDSAMLLPTRDINDVFKMLTAYFGGGTVFDPKKMKDYFKMLAMKGDLERLGIKGVNISNEKDYEKLLARLDPVEREKLKTKELNVRLKQKVKEYYEKVDHVLLTDGGIFNLDEVIEYFNQTGEYT